MSPHPYGSEYQRKRKLLLQRHKLCHWCSSPATEADHYPPLEYGGNSDQLVPACRKCNAGHAAEKAWLAANGLKKGLVRVTDGQPVTGTGANRWDDPDYHGEFGPSRDW